MPLLIDPYRFGVVTVSAQTPPAASTSGLTTYTFSGAAIGTASSDRRIVVAIGSRANAARSVSSVTVGGISATELVTANDSGSGADIASLWIAEVPTGTTGDIVVTFSAAMLRCAVAQYAVYGMGSNSAFHTQASAGSVANNVARSVSINVPANGAVIGADWGAGSGSPTCIATWTELTEQNETNLGTVSNVFSSASKTYSAIQTGLSVTATVSQSAANVNGGLAVASFAPY